MVDSLKNNFFILPALLLALLLYGGFLRVQKAAPYRSLIPASSAAVFEGRVVGSPVKIHGRRPAYKVTLDLSRAWSKQGVAAEASGQADFFLPAELCEIHKPGKLYTAWRGKADGFLLDSGAVVQLEANEERAAAFESREILSCRWPKGFWGGLQKIRALSRLHFVRLMYAWGSAGGLLLALLSGERSYLAKELSDAFRTAGLSHILALSGMHLSLFGGLAFALGKRAGGKKIALALEFFCMAAFVWFAGKSPSLFRAMLCSLCAIFYSLFKVRAKSGLNSLSLAFIVHVSLFPADALELSFMLSYGALAGILSFNEIFSSRIAKALPGGAGAGLGASAGAQLFTAPISLKFFGLAAPGGVLSSAAVSPLATVFIYAGLFFVLLSLAFPPAAPFCGALLSVLYQAIRRSVLFFAQIPCVKI